MYLLYDPLQTEYKSSLGAVEISLPFTVSVDSDADKVNLLLKKEGENENVVTYPMIKTGGRFSVELAITTTGLYRYYFTAGGVAYYADASLRASTEGEQWTVTAYEKLYDEPDWLYGGVIYQIFPDRFAIGGQRKKTKPDMLYRDDWGGTPLYKPNDRGIVENRDMFGGNFLGIAEKTDYLASLGVTCIYLNPVFESFSNHKYDTANYALTDSDFGSLKDFAYLISEAEKRGIKIILDGVFSHTGSDSIYFNKNHRYENPGAYEKEPGPYDDWYKFEEFPEKYECWWGITTLPGVDENTPSFNRYINGDDGVIRRYMDMGIAGWRLDVADELPDEFLCNLTKTAKKSYKNALVLGEVWENAATKYSYGKLRSYLCGKQLDSVTDYPLKNAILDFVTGGGADALDNTVRRLINDYPERVLHCVMNFIDTHDTPRALALLGEFDDVSTKEARSEAKILNYARAVKKLKQAAVLQFFLPGVPSVYYGDEAGMYGFEDPFNRRCYPWEKADSELISFYAVLGGIRREYRGVFAKGSYNRLPSSDGVMRFIRKSGADALEIVVNVSDSDYITEKVCTDLLTGKELSAVESGGSAVFKSA